MHFFHDRLFIAQLAIASINTIMRSSPTFCVLSTQYSATAHHHHDTRPVTHNYGRSGKCIVKRSKGARAGLPISMQAKYVCNVNQLGVNWYLADRQIEGYEKSGRREEYITCAVSAAGVSSADAACSACFLGFFSNFPPPRSVDWFAFLSSVDFHSFESSKLTFIIIFTYLRFIRRTIVPATSAIAFCRIQTSMRLTTFLVSALAGLASVGSA